MGTSRKAAMNFKTMMQSEVPQGRNGKHKQIITRILADLDQYGNAYPDLYWRATGRLARFGLPQSLVTQLRRVRFAAQKTAQIFHKTIP